MTGTEVHRHVADGVPGVADRDEDYVPLVSLDILQVLDEEGLRSSRREERGEVGRSPAATTSNSSRMASRCETEKAPTPKDCLGCRLACSTTASATAFASTRLVAVPPRSKDPALDEPEVEPVHRGDRRRAGDDEEAAVVGTRGSRRRSANGGGSGSASGASAATSLAPRRARGCSSRSPGLRSSPSPWVSSSSSILLKNRVGGSCLSSPTTTTCAALAIAPRGVDRAHLARFVDQEEVEADAPRFEELRDPRSGSS